MCYIFFCDFLWTIWSLNFEPLDLARIFIVFVGHGVRDFFNREKREIKNRENKYQRVSLKKESGRKIDQGLTISS